MTAMELRRAFVAQAKKWLGRKEADNSHREIIDVYNSIKPLPNGYRMKYTDPWCAAFVSAVAWLCGLIKIIFPSASCPDMVAKYKAAGRWMENDAYMPQIGDIIFYDWDDSGKGDNTGVPDHVGIVSDVFSSSFNIIEGNYSDAVKQRTMQRNAKNIRGFGLPDFESMAGESIDVPAAPEIPVQDEKPQTAPTAPAPAAPSVKLDCDVKLPTLQYGAKNGYVTSFQQMLLARGYSVGGPVRNGKEQPDGEFGPTMRKNVIAWQKKAGLSADGIVGEKSWSAMLAGK